jgi:anti-sigma B factor antagonist
MTVAVSQRSSPTEGAKLMSTRRPSFVAGTRSRTEDLLTLRLVDPGPVAVIEVVGELDMDTTHVLTDFAGSVLQAQSPLVMLLDLTGLRFCCADGIRALLHVRDAAYAQAAQLILRDPSPIICRVLKLSGTLDVFEIKTSSARAV